MHLTLLGSLLAVTMLALACGGGPPNSATSAPPAESSPTQTATQGPASPTATAMPGSSGDPPSPAPFATATPYVESSPQQSVETLMYRLIQGRGQPGDRSEAVSALAEIEASGNRAFVPALIELLPVPLTREELTFNNEAVLPTLERITGQGFGYDPKAWTEWLVRQPDIAFPEAYTRWKVDLLSGVDPRFRSYFLDQQTDRLYPPEKFRIDLPLVVWGGVLKDDGTGIRSIPALVNPAMVGPNEANYLADDDRVFGVSINGDSRAYPLRIMNWHEMANDVVGGVPVALAYCTLCGSGILYETEVGDAVFTFRTSGLLYKSNKLMYDVGTNTLWNQFNGEPAIGGLADSGIKLKMLPVSLTTWVDWLAGHPETRVLSIDTGYLRNYASEGRPGAAYNEYFSIEDVWFPVSEQDKRLSPKATVFGLQFDEATRAYPVEKLKGEPVLVDEVGGVAVLLITNAITGEVRAYQLGEVSFPRGSSGGGAGPLIDDLGGEWRIEDSGLVSVEDPGRRLEQVAGRTAFWFAWFSFHPETSVYGEDG